MNGPLLLLAVLPVVLLCVYIYIKDTNKEPFKLLAMIFGFGFVAAVPVIFVELILSKFFGTEGVTNFVVLFMNVFIAVALIEEGGKWIITKGVGYNNKEFDEIYDIIVYSVFASLGFACIENILYVLGQGVSVAIGRALTSIPGHMCFGVLMGYFLAKAKISSMNKSQSLYKKNMILSILVPALAHSLYDSLIFASVNLNDPKIFLIFLVFDITMVVVCFRTVKVVSKIQINVVQNLDDGLISKSEGHITINNTEQTFSYCPVCGSYIQGYNFCGRCGYKSK